MKTNRGKITLASKYNNNGIRIYIPEKMRKADGNMYVQTYRIRYAHPNGLWPYLISLNEQIRIKMTFDAVSIDLNTPFTADYLRRAIGRATANLSYLPQTKTQVAGEKTARLLISSEQQQAYDEAVATAPDESKKLQVMADGYYMITEDEYKNR